MLQYTLFLYDRGILHSMKPNNTNETRKYRKRWLTFQVQNPMRLWVKTSPSPDETDSSSSSFIGGFVSGSPMNSSSCILLTFIDNFFVHSSLWMRRSVSVVVIFLHAFFYYSKCGKTYKNLARLDSGLDENPTVMVLDKTKKNKFRQK